MTDVYELIEEHFPYDGPHSSDTVADAAAAIAELVRYLDNATGPGNARTTLSTAPRVDRLLGSVIGATYGLEQLLHQLAGALTRHAANPSIYDDRRDRPGRDTARQAAEALRTAMPLATRLTGQLEAARSLTFHLGHDRRRQQ